MTKSPFGDSSFVVPVFSPRDDPIACLNKAMAFLMAVASSRFPTTNNQLITSFNPRNQATIQDGRVTVQQVQGRQGQNYSGTTYKGNATSSKGNTTNGQARVVKCYNCQEAQEAGKILDEEQLAFLADLGILADQAQTIIPHNAAFQIEDLDTYDSDCDDLSTAQAVLMANISDYGSNIISEVPNSETYLNDMDNQSVHALQDFEQSPVMDFTDNEISSDSNIIPYSQYLQETQQATVQDTNFCRENMIVSQMDDMIREKLALKEQIDSLEKNLSKQIKEKESLFKTFSIFKNNSKEKENKYLENEIDLEKKIKELDNIICKVGQSAHTVKMLTKPQAFYDNTHKQALGYQNPFYLRKAERMKPTLYDDVVLSNTHVAMPVINDEETLILEEESRSKMSEKAKDPKVIAKKISHKPIDYENLNSLTDDFEKRFSPQQELSAEQAFWFHTLNHTIEPSYTPPVIVDVPSELPKITVTPMNNVKKVRFAEPITSSSKTQQVESSKTSDSNTLVLSSTGVKCSTSNCGSKPPGNKKNDRISQIPSRNKKNKVEAQPRKVNKKNRVVKHVCDVDVKHSLSNANSKILCASCNKSMVRSVHENVFTTTNVVPSKQTTSHSDEIQKLEIKVYSRKPKNAKNIGSSNKAKIVESKNANHSEPNQTWGSNAIDISSSSSLVMTSCPDCTLIRERPDCKHYGDGDYQLGNVVISRVYYVEGLEHNLFSVGQFCDADLKVAFRKNTCFIHNLEGVDLLSGSRDINLYKISLDDMLRSSLICLISKASKTKSWLWHLRLSHLNFGTLNKLAKDGLARGIPRLKFQKDHLCSACSLGKSKKSSH
ncbi:retrovirus-related pol polyprotein from transposon TNT 1-94 [Tanacetum coccineum]